MIIMQCHILQPGIIYVNHAMPSCLASHRICELYRAIFFYNVFHLSTMFIHSSTLPVHQPFESIMGKSGVKTRSSKQSVLPVDADFLLVTDSSSEVDSETDDQSYPPPSEVHALTWLGYIAHIMHMVSCIAMSSAQIRHVLCECLLLAFYIRYVNYAMPSCLARHHICEFCNTILLSQSSYM